MRLAAFLQIGAAITLGIYAAASTSRVQFLGMKVAGIHIALFGGIAASCCLTVCACLEWVLSWPAAVGASGLTMPFHLLAFAAGGPAYVASFGLLVAGVALVGGLQRFLARWLMFTGLAIALVAELSTLVFLLPSLVLLLPLARFAGLAWIIAVGAALPQSKTRRPAWAPA